MASIDLTGRKRMELRHLRYFVAVADVLHFGRAAASLQIAQPSLSHQIRQLEMELQTTLLHRTNRRVELTEAGRLFLEAARDILTRADEAAMKARRKGRGLKRRMRVGVGYCMNQSMVIAAVTEFGRRHRDVQVELSTMSIPSQVSALRDRRLDVGFLRPPVTEPGIATEALISEPLVAALPRKHRLARRTRVALSALVDEPLVLVPRETVPLVHEAVLKACRDAGFVPRVSHEADHLQMILGIVATVGGVALVPAAAQEVAQPGVVLRSLGPPPPRLATAIAWRQDDPSPQVADLVSIARATSGRRLRHATGLGHARR
jgi:DNA-binding transcriptional LysR family regulator